MRVNKICIAFLLLMSFFLGPKIVSADYAHEEDTWGYKNINDGGGWANRTKWQLGISGVPAGSTITKIKVRARIDHSRYADLVMQVSKQKPGGGSWVDYKFWNHRSASGDRNVTADDIDEFNSSGVDPNGDWYIVVWDDYSGNSGKIEEAEIWVYYDPPKPDLEVTLIKMDGSTSGGQHFKPSESIKLEFRGHNDGSATSKKSIRMKWWYGTSSGSTTHEIGYGYLGIYNGLSPDEYEWETDATWSVPSTPGTYYLTVIIDDNNNQNDESDETNNERSLKFYVDTPDTPDATRSSPSSGKTVQKGDTVTFKVRGQDDDGDLDYVYWWYDSGTKNKDEMSGDDDTDSHSFTFNTAGTHYIHADVYDAGGRHDDVTWTVYVNTSPTAPSNIRGDSITDDGARILWDASYDADGDTRTYQVYSGKTYFWDGWKDHEKTTGESKIISGLDPNYSYTIKVVVTDGNGGSNEDEESSCFKTLPTESVSKPDKPSTSVSTDILTGTSLSFTSGNSSCNWPGHSVQYKFNFGDGNDSGWLNAASASHRFDSPGDWNVKVYARCKTHTSVVSSPSSSLKISVQRPKSGEITGDNKPTNFGGLAHEVTINVKNKGRDDKNLIIVPAIPQGWKVSPNDQQTKVPYGTENKSYFKFKITPPSSSDSTGSIIWKLYYDETYPTANTLLGDYTMSVSSKPRGSISAYLYNQHNEEAADAKTKFSFWARDQHPVGENPKLFSDIPITADGYWISGYQKGKFSEWEYWGSKKIVVQKNITLPLNIVRNMPWSTDITIHKASDHSVVGATINPGTEVYAAIHVVNNDSVDHRCKVEFLLDGSNGGMDWSNIIGDVNLTKNGGTQTFRTAHFTPGEGDYSGGFKVRTLNNDGNAWDVTDTRVNYPQFKAVVNRPTLGSITLTDLDGNSVSKLEPGKRYIASTSYHDKDGRGDLKECKVILRNSNDSRRDIELIYDVANDRKKVGDGSGDTCFETRVGKPVLDDYVHLTHVEVSDAVNGYDVRYIFWLSAKWAENKSGGVRVHAKAKDQAGNSSPESELQKAFNFEPLSLPADKWTVIVHGKSNSDDNNFLVPGLGQGPWSWDVNPTTWFKGMSDPTTHSSRNPYDAWAWEIGYKFNHISKTPVKIHRLGDRNAFTLETWSDTISRNADYGPYDYDSKSHNILIFDWDDPSDYLDLDDWSEDNWYAYASGDALYALISKLGIQDNINTVIGYSRGGVVSSEFARRMRIEGKTGFQVIYLDAEGWGEFDNELSAQQFAEGAVDFSNIKLSVDVASVIGGKYVGTAADIVKYAVDWAFPPELSNDWEADNASELSLLKDVLGLPYADYRFFGFEGLRVDQYRQAYSNPEKMFCGAESLSGGGNDQLVEGWPAYTAATNYSSVPVDISIGDELSHTFFPHYLTDWCYLAQDATKGNSVCIETPQLWRWQDQNDAWQTRAILSYPTLQASTPDNTTGDVFNSGARDGSAAGWSYHGGITPFESWGINGIEKVDDGYEFQFELPNGLEELVHNWQVTPRAPKRLRFDLEYRDAFFEEYDEFHVYWNNYTHLKTVRSSDVYEVQKSIQCNFYYPDTVGRLYFRSFFNGAEFLLDNVEFDSDEPPRISTFEVFPSSISRGEDLTFRASGVQVGDASIDRVEFYLDDGDGVFDYATDGDSVPIATVDSGSENVWEVTKSSENVPEGTLWFFAVAWDANHLDSYPVISKAQVTVTQPANRLPTIGSLNCDGSVVRGNVLTLTTTGISDSEDGSVAKVVFYYDENRNGILDIGAGDRKLATDLSGNSTSTYDVDTAALPAGTAMFFAVAYDSKNARSASVSCRSSVIQKWQLSYSVSGSGTILEKPDAGSYKDGTVVNPSASANSGGEFNHWEANGLTVSMPIWLHENTTITAVFVPSGGGAVAPVINRIEKQSVALGQAFSFTPTLQQGDAPITWSLENKPTGMTIDQLGIISWSSPAPSGSSHVVVVKASNSARSDIRSDMKSFTLYVTAPRYMLTVNKGNGGGEYSEGRTINISPTPQPDGIFSHWTGDTQNLIGSVLTMPANPITVTANFKPAPDLVATNGTYEARRYLHDETLPISITSTNIGTANATGEFLVQAVLSPDKVWDNGNDYPLGTNLVNKLVLGQELVETINGVVSTSIPEGSYYLGVKIDATNNVVEIVEDNNVWWSDALDVDISAHPAWSFDPSTNIHASGEADSGAFTVNQIAGLDAAWTASVHSASADWITLDSNYSDGMGSGDEVRYSIPLNDTRLNRTGSILVEGLPFVVEQSAHLPLVPICIHPNDGQSNVERDLTLWWKDGGYSSGYEIWFGKDSGTLKFVAEITSSAMTNSYQTGLREEAQPFQWQVIAFNEGGSTNGAVWRFSTENKLRPGEVFEQNGMDWNNTSTVPWFAQTVEKYSGSAAMQSGAIGDGQVSVLEATVVGPGTLDFWWKVDSEANDFLNLYLGTNLYDGIAGSGNWMQESVPVPTGVQKLSWKYEKDGSGSTGTDCGWLDDVQWQGENSTTFPLSGFADKWVATYLWDKTANEWIVLSNSEKGPTEVVVKNIKPDQWYWLCVMEYDGTNWNLAHGSWISHLDEM